MRRIRRNPLVDEKGYAKMPPLVRDGPVTPICPSEAVGRKQVDAELHRHSRPDGTPLSMNLLAISTSTPPRLPSKNPILRARAEALRRHGPESRRTSYKQRHRHAAAARAKLFPSLRTRGHIIIRYAASAIASH